MMAEEKTFPDQLKEGVRFFEAANRLTPTSPKAHLFLDRDSKFWIENPHPHERALVASWLYMVEKREIGRIEDGEVEGLITILKGIIKSDEPSFSDSPSSRTKRAPLLLKKGVIKGFINQYQDRGFYKKGRPQWQGIMIGNLRELVLRLGKGGIINADYIRHLNKIEKIVAESIKEERSAPVES